MYVRWIVAHIYPVIRSIGLDTKFTVRFFFIHYVRLQISQPGLYRSAWNFAWRFDHISDRSSPILRHSSSNGWVMSVNRGHMAGYASCWSTSCRFSFYHASICEGCLWSRNTVRLSVCPSVTRVHCDKTKWRTADIFITHKKAIILLLWYQERLMGDAPFPLKSALKMTHPLRKTPTSTHFRL